MGTKRVEKSGAKKNYFKDYFTINDFNWQQFSGMIGYKMAS